MSEGRLRVTRVRGDAYAIAIGPHRVVVDQPLAAGGDDLGPTPTDLFVGSLAACAAFFAGRFLRRHAAAETPLEVLCTFEMSEDRPARVRSVGLTLIVDAALGDELRAAVTRAVQQCTVHNSIRQPTEVSVTVRQRTGAAV